MFLETPEISGLFSWLCAVLSCVQLLADTV